MSEIVLAPLTGAEQEQLVKYCDEGLLSVAEHMLEGLQGSVPASQIRRFAMERRRTGFGLGPDTSQVKGRYGRKRENASPEELLAYVLEESTDDLKANIDSTGHRLRWAIVAAKQIHTADRDKALERLTVLALLCGYPRLATVASEGLLIVMEKTVWETLLA